MQPARECLEACRVPAQASHLRLELKVKAVRSQRDAQIAGNHMPRWAVFILVLIVNGVAVWSLLCQIHCDIGVLQ